MSGRRGDVRGVRGEDQPHVSGGWGGFFNDWGGGGGGSKLVTQNSNCVHVHMTNLG